MNNENTWTQEGEHTHWGLLGVGRGGTAEGEEVGEGEMDGVWE